MFSFRVSETEASVGVHQDPNGHTDAEPGLRDPLEDVFITVKDFLINWSDVETQPKSHNARSNNTDERDFDGVQAGFQANDPNNFQDFLHNQNLYEIQGSGCSTL